VAEKKASIEEQLKKERLLNRITHQLHDARDLDEILLYLKNEIIALFDAERITVYGVDTEKREIYSGCLWGKPVWRATRRCREKHLTLRMFTTPKS
jgi:GAF domain-containing protein